MTKDVVLGVFRDDPATATERGLTNILDQCRPHRYFYISPLLHDVLCTSKGRLDFFLAGIVPRRRAQNNDSLFDRYQVPHFLPALVLSMTRPFW